MGHRDRGVEVLDPDTGARFRSNGKPFRESPGAAAPAGGAHSGGAGVSPIIGSGSGGGGKPNPKPKHKHKSKAKHYDYVSALLLQPGQRPLVGFYGQGVVQLPERFTPPPASLQHRRRLTHQSQSQPASQPRASTYPPLPSSAKPPTLKQLQAMLATVKKLHEPLPNTWAAYLGDDWMTQGDWVGRYGRECAVLCAMMSSFDHIFTWNPVYKVKRTIGPHHRKGDTLRGWIEWLKTNTPKVLYDPSIGHRRGASWDDHSESYSATYEGPDIWIKVVMPPGVFRISLYFMNKDGHTAGARARDYVVKVTRFMPNLIRSRHLPVLAKARVIDFWGGVYKQFIIHSDPTAAGPQKSSAYWVHICRNYSHCTIMSAVLIDQLAGPPSPFADNPLPWLGGYRYGAPDPYPNEDTTFPVEAFHHVLQTRKRAWRYRRGAEINAAPDMDIMRTALSIPANTQTLRLLRWRFHTWTLKDRMEFASTMRKGWARHN